MKLSLLSEVAFDKVLDKSHPLLRTMNRQKRRHSKNVAKMLHKVGASKTAVFSGALHDYLERGGNLETLSNHIDEFNLPRQVIDIVNSLSYDENNVGDENNQPLVHLQSVMSSLVDPDIKNMIVLVKLSDRIDNLKKRYNRKGKINNRYRQKSTELVQYLVSQYTGKQKYLNKLLKHYDRVMAEMTNRDDLSHLSE